MDRVKSVMALDGFRLRVEYTDGLAGTVDISDWLSGPMFEPLKDPDLFRQAEVDEYGAVNWPNGADLAPDGHLRSRLEQQAGRTPEP